MTRQVPSISFPGKKGDNGWTPQLAMVADAVRRVFQVTDWTGGSGIKPAVGKYVGTTGLVDLITDAIDIRGPLGPQGLQGLQGIPGLNGAPGPAPKSITSANFVQPASGANVTVSVDTTSWMGVGQSVFVTGGGYYTVAAIVDATHVTLTITGNAANAAAGAAINAWSAVVVAGSAGNGGGLTYVDLLSVSIGGTGADYADWDAAKAGIAQHAGTALILNLGATAAISPDTVGVAYVGFPTYKYVIINAGGFGLTPGAGTNRVVLDRIGIAGTFDLSALSSSINIASLGLLNGFLSNGTLVAQNFDANYMQCHGPATMTFNILGTLNFVGQCSASVLLATSGNTVLNGLLVAGSMFIGSPIAVISGSRFGIDSLQVNIPMAAALSLQSASEARVGRFTDALGGNTAIARFDGKGCLAAYSTYTSTGTSAPIINGAATPQQIGTSQTYVS